MTVSSSRQDELLALIILLERPVTWLCEDQRYALLDRFCLDYVGEHHVKPIGICDAPPGLKIKPGPLLTPEAWKMLLLGN